MVSFELGVSSFEFGNMMGIALARHATAAAVLGAYSELETANSKLETPNPELP